MSASSFAGGLYENAWESTRLVGESARIAGLGRLKSAVDLVWLILHRHRTFEPVRLGQRDGFGSLPYLPYVRPGRWFGFPLSTPACARPTPVCFRPTPHSSEFRHWHCSSSCAQATLG